MIVAGRDLGQELVKALGLEGKKVRSLMIRCELDEPAIVTAEVLVVDLEAGEVATVLKRYRLVPAEDAAE